MNGMTYWLSGLVHRAVRRGLSNDFRRVVPARRDGRGAFCVGDDERARRECGRSNDAVVGFRRAATEVGLPLEDFVGDRAVLRLDTDATRLFRDRRRGLARLFHVI